MNIYQHGLLTWSFQKVLAGMKVDSQIALDWEPLNEDLAWSNRLIILFIYTFTWKVNVNSTQCIFNIYFHITILKQPNFES